MLTPRALKVICLACGILLLAVLYVLVLVKAFVVVI